MCVEAYASQDATLLELAAAYGVSRQAMWAHLHKARVTRPRYVVAAGHREDVIDLHAAGVKIQEIADRTEISRATVERMLRKYRASKRLSKSGENEKQRTQAEPGAAQGAVRGDRPQRHPWRARLGQTG